MKEIIQIHLTKKNRFELIENEIDSLLLKINKTETINEAEPLFKKLEDIQFELARIIFKDKIKTTNNLRMFVHDFDRLDDIDVKTNLYYNLKKSDSIR